VSFTHRFGVSLNRHVHHHCCGIDELFKPAEDATSVTEALQFRPAVELTPVEAIAEQARIRLLRWFARSGLIQPDDERDMLALEKSGLSLNAAGCGHSMSDLLSSTAHRSRSDHVSSWPAASSHQSGRKRPLCSRQRTPHRGSCTGIARTVSVDSDAARTTFAGRKRWRLDTLGGNQAGAMGSRSSRARSQPAKLAAASGVD
jgi:hypothetical protein